MRRLKSIVCSWDTLITLIVSGITYYFIPDYMSMKFMLSIYNVAITVLSIIFSLFFAALAILMSSSDNDFIEFLEEEKTFTELLWSFKVTLLILFISLLYSIILYTFTSFYIESYVNEIWLQHKIFFTTLELVFIYSMMATGLSIIDTIEFSEYRSKFLSKTKEKK